MQSLKLRSLSGLHMLSQVLRRREPVAEVVSSFVVGADSDGPLPHAPDVREHGDGTYELNRALGERHELSLTRRHGDAVLPTPV